MIYQLLVGYFALRFTLELLFDEDIPETDIRAPCNCTMCSGLCILNHHK